MKRRFFTFLSAVSLVLSTATCVLWARSHYVKDSVVFTTSGLRLVRVTSSRGTVGLMSARDWPSREQFSWQHSSDFSKDTGPFILFFAGQDDVVHWDQFGVKGDHGVGRTLLDNDGKPRMVMPAEDAEFIQSEPMPEWSIFVPAWMPAVLTAFLPSLWVVLQWRRKLAAGRFKWWHPMMHALIAIMTVLSLALCIATCIAWVRSYWVVDDFTLDRAQYPPTVDEDFANSGPLYLADISTDSLRVNRGAIAIIHEHSTDHLTLGPINVKEWSEDHPPGWHFQYARSESYKEIAGFPLYVANPRVLLNRFGFFYGTCGIPGLFYGSIDYIRTDIECPAWLLVALTAVMPAMRAATRMRKHRRARQGRCLSCGYDLRATPERCPECGTETQFETGAEKTSST